MSARKDREKPQKEVSKVVKFFFTLFVLAVLALIGIFIYEKIYHGPSAIVDEYVDSFMARSPGRIFRQLNLEQSNFVTPENLDRLLREKADYENITSYSLVPLTQINDDEKQYEIHYMMGRLESPFSQVITLKKEDEKFLFLFDRWRIDSADLTGTRITIRVPLGAELTVDGQPVPETELRKKSEEDQDFELGSMFVGKHEFTVKLDGFLEYTDTFPVEAKDYMDEPIVTVTTNHMAPNLDNQNKARDLVQEIIPKVYECVLSRSAFEYFLSQVATESTTQAVLRPKYEALLEKNTDPDNHLMFVDFEGFESAVASTPSTDDCYAVCVTTKLRYTANYMVLQDEESKLVPIERKKKIRTVFHYNNGQWQLYDSTIFDKFG